MFLKLNRLAPQAQPVLFFLPLAVVTHAVTFFREKKIVCLNPVFKTGAIQDEQ